MRIRYATVSEDGVHITFFGETVASEMMYTKLDTGTLAENDVVCVLEDDLGKRIILGKVEV